MYATVLDVGVVRRFAWRPTRHRASLFSSDWTAACPSAMLHVCVVHFPTTRGSSRVARHAQRSFVNRTVSTRPPISAIRPHRPRACTDRNDVDQLLTNARSTAARPTTQRPTRKPVINLYGSHRRPAAGGGSARHDVTDVFLGARRIAGQHRLASVSRMTASRPDNSRLTSERGPTTQDTPTASTA
jgi:hypothetical protein